MTQIQSVRFNVTNAFRHLRPLPPGSVALGRTRGGSIIPGRRICLTNEMLSGGVSIRGCVRAGIHEVFRLVVSRLLDSGRKVVVVSDESDIFSLYKQVFDLKCSKQFIQLRPSMALEDDIDGAMPVSGCSMLSDNWSNADLIGVDYKGADNRSMFSADYLSKLVAWARQQADRVIVFFGSAHGQTHPLVSEHNVIMFCTSMAPDVNGVAPTNGGRILMRVHPEDVAYENPVAADMAPMRAILSLNGREVEFSFDRPSKINPVGPSFVMPYRIIDGITGNADEDIRLIEARRRVERR